MKRGGFKKNAKKAVVYGLVGLMGITGCKKSSTPSPNHDKNPNPPQSGTVYYDNVKMLSKSDLENITSYSDNSISFSDASKYHSGDILVGGIGNESPNGFLKKVDRVEGNKIYVSNSSLDKMIETGKISYDKNLTPSDFNGNLKNTNIDKDYKFHKPIDKIIYDGDGNYQTTKDQLKLVGDFYFDLDVGLDAKFDSGLESFETYSKVSGELDLNLEGELEKKVSWKDNLFKIKFTPIVIAPGVIARPVVSGGLDLEAEVKGNFSIGADLKNVNEQKILYQRGIGWSHPINKNEFTFDKKSPKVNLIVNSNSGLSERASLLLYGISGPFVEAREYLRFHSDINENPWWKLYGGLEMNVGVDPGLLSNVMDDYKLKVFEKEKLISEADSAIRNPPKESFEEDFEDNPVGSFPSDWTADANAFTNKSKVISENGNHVLQLYGERNGCWAALAYHKRTIDPPYNIEVKIKNGVENLGGCHPSRACVGIRDSDSWTGPGKTLLNFNKDGYIIDAEGKFIMKTKNGTWNDYKINIDKNSDGTYNLEYYVNDTSREILKGMNLPLNYKNFELQSNEGYAYFDNFKVTGK